ncbi:MAG: hypothetical protein J6Y82_05985 [Bacteroidales bacterium]|nr:hypothetical protein [Bacteroidales bacterium]
MSRLYRYIGYVTLLAMPFGIASCDDDPVQLDTFKGIGTIERTADNVALHFYDYTFLIDNAEMCAKLNDNNRVIFECLATRKVSTDSTLVFAADMISVSDDRTRPILSKSTCAEEPEKLKSSAFVPSDLHITRDWRRSDFFNITILYTTISDNCDSLVMLRYADEQTTQADTVTLWVKLLQQRNDTSSLYSHKTISVPLNGFITDTTERICLRVKHLSTPTDTVVKDYIYSWK